MSSALGERGEDDAAHAVAPQDVEQLRLDPAVEQRVRGLVDEQRRAQLAQDPLGLLGARGRVGRHPDVERLARAHGGVQRAHRLLQRRLGVGAVRVEDVDVVQPHALEALVEAGEQVLARAPVAVGSGPHVVARLAGDDELVAVGRQVLGEDPAEVLLRRPVGRPVVVGQVEVGDAEVERAAQDGPARLQRPVAAEVLPQAERDRRELEAAAPTAPVGHRLIAVLGGSPGHHGEYSRSGRRPILSVA